MLILLLFFFFYDCMNAGAVHTCCLQNCSPGTSCEELEGTKCNPAGEINTHIYSYNIPIHTYTHTQRGIRSNLQMLMINSLTPLFFFPGNHYLMYPIISEASNALLFSPCSIDLIKNVVQVRKKELVLRYHFLQH